MTRRYLGLRLILTGALLPACLAAQQDNAAKLPQGLVAPGAQLVRLPGEYSFTEGPAADKAGNVYFTDIPANRIYKWSLDGTVSPFREDTGGANGLYFDKRGHLIACQGGLGKMASIAPTGALTPIAEEFEGKRFNSPNDLWVDPQGGVYFTDPVYGRRTVVQGGEHVYYVPPDHSSVVRVIDDMVRPNGLIGTPDGKTLYVTDHGAKRTYRYAVCEDGTLKDKTLFCDVGCDGMTRDTRGNLYLAEADIIVFDADGKRLGVIDIPQRPTNVCFGGAQGKTLFVTARTAVYTLQMAIAGQNR